MNEVIDVDAVVPKKQKTQPTLFGMGVKLLKTTANGKKATIASLPLFVTLTNVMLQFQVHEDDIPPPTGGEEACKFKHDGCPFTSARPSALISHEKTCAHSGQASRRIMRGLAIYRTLSGRPDIEE